MKGHIKQRAKGSWTIWVDLGRDPTTGKRKQQTMTIRGSNKDAEHELRTILTRIEGGILVKPTKRIPRTMVTRLCGYKHCPNYC